MNLSDFFSMLGGGDQNAAAVNQGIAPMLGPVADAGNPIATFLASISGQAPSQAQAAENPPPPVDQATAKVRALMAVKGIQSRPEDTYAAVGDTIARGDNGKLVRGSFSRTNAPIISDSSSNEKQGAINMAKRLGVDEADARLMAKKAIGPNGKFDFEQFQKSVESNARASNYTEQTKQMIGQRELKDKMSKVQSQLSYAPDTKSKIAAINAAESLSGNAPTSIPVPDIQNSFWKDVFWSMLGNPQFSPVVKNQSDIDAAIAALLQHGNMLADPAGKGQGRNPLTEQAIKDYLNSLYSGK